MIQAKLPTIEPLITLSESCPRSIGNLDRTVEVSDAWRQFLLPNSPSANCMRKKLCHVAE